MSNEHRTEWSLSVVLAHLEEFSDPSTDVSKKTINLKTFEVHF